MTKKNTQILDDREYKPHEKKFCYKRRTFSISKCNTSYWSVDEKSKYKDFLKQNKDLFID